jgi:hypothetical protein
MMPSLSITEGQNLMQLCYEKGAKEATKQNVWQVVFYV